MKRIHFQLALGTLAAIAMLVGRTSSSSASDQPQFHHSGTMCRATGGDAVLFNQGSIANGSYSETMTLHCPVVRENDASEIGTMC